ncbi:MAG: type I DNA topoisomerase [Parcubacteria group bacterium]|nr:type I DNA topoisomerase [Parcubacteria group bacterium]
MKLVIVESPAKAKTINKYLGDDYVVKSSVGHIRDIPKSSKGAIDIEAGFVPNYQIIPGKEKVVKELAAACKKADEVVLATDPDREGEAISWHIAEICNLNKTPEKVKRIVFHEITEKAVQEAVKNPRSIDMNLKSAQEARRVLDRLFGYDLSGLIWKKLRYGLSAGRVQSPALRILMEQEKEIRAFKPENFWVITAETKTKSGDGLTLTCVQEPRDEKEAERIVAAGKKGSWKVMAVEEKEQRRAPRAPFTTSTLQQSASSRLGISPSQTMRLAQGLYEEGHITYMRTDSTNMAADAQKSILAFVRKEYGNEYMSANVYKTKSKSAQEAHEAIRPTHIEKQEVGRTEAHKKLYALIWQRAVSSQMTDAKALKTKITANIDGGETIPDFAANGSRIVFEGWLRADPRARGEDVELPKVGEQDPLSLVDVASEKKATEPPNRYTEAGLIKELEKRGIGRPSTYASIMKTLVDREYVRRENRTLYPTDLGDVVNEFLEKNFTHYISDTFTAEMEDKLDQIAEGNRSYEATLKEFYGPFHEAVGAKADIDKITDIAPAPDDIRCPECSSAMVVKLGRIGKFYSCKRFPECKGARVLDGSIMKKEVAEETGEKCPECSKPLVKRAGRFGEFIGCSGYPKCRYVKQVETSDGKPLVNTTGVKCPECGKGELAERKGRFGMFYACTAYPKCRFSMKAKPTGNICPKCSSLMMEGTKTIPERCSNKACAMHNPHKIKPE